MIETIQIVLLIVVCLLSFGLARWQDRDDIVANLVYAIFLVLMLAFILERWLG